MSTQNQTLEATTPNHTGAILEAEHLRKLFPVHQGNPFQTQRAVHAVEDASLALYPGRATAIVGESGSGKTTIARMLARIYDPTSGALRFRGEPVKLFEPCICPARIPPPRPARVSGPIFFLKSGA